MTATAHDRKAVETRLRAALSGIIDNRTGKDVLTSGFVSGWTLKEAEAGYRVSITVELPGGPGVQNEALCKEIEAAVSTVEGINAVSLIETAHRATPAAPSGGHGNPLGTTGPAEEKPIPGVRAVIAVASGKGGVGKSTVAANLAAAFAAAGYATGIVDADIYGPSLPVLLGLKGRAEFAEGKIQPMSAHGLKAMSIGWLVSEEKALAWRGPMVMGAVRQLFTDVDWGKLDILIVDTPPGTGDAHLTLLQKIPVSGAVIVSTSQEMALTDVRRGTALFASMDTPVLGIVENMAYFELPDGSRQPLFGKDGVQHTAEMLGLDLLASLPLVPELGHSADAGLPMVLSHPDSAISGQFREIAKKLAGKLALVPATGDA